MTTTLIIVVCALVAVLLLLRAARGHAKMVRELSQLEGLTRPVDVAAFRNLVDPAEEEYLRACLPRSAFRNIQRQRMRAALEYVERTANNGSILLRLGEAARSNENPEIAAAGHELASGALLLCLYAKLVIPLLLYARIMLPGAHVSVGRIIDKYEIVTESVARLTRLQNPAYTACIAAMI